MRKLLYISLIALAGCTTPLQPGQVTPPSGSDFTAYFWPDTTATYQYQSPQGNHKVVLSGMTVFDYGPNGSTTTFLVSKMSKGVSLSGFTSSDLLGFDPWLQVVSDTIAPQPFTESISSIAAVGFNQQWNVFALSSSSTLYKIDPNARTIGQPIGNLPPGFVLAEDAHGSVLFAYRLGGDSILVTSDEFAWPITLAPAPVTAFCSAYGFSQSNLCWFACGNSVYRIGEDGDMSGPIALPTGSNIIAMSPSYSGSSDGVTVGTSDGLIYDVSTNGQTKYRQTLPGLKQIVNTGFSVFVASPSGLFAVTFSNKLDTIVSGNFTSVYSNGSSLFASRSDSVFNINTGNYHIIVGYPTPGSKAVNDFARSSSSSSVYAVAGTSTYVLNNTSWNPINQFVQPQWFPTPGGLTLLASDTSSWLAGYVANFHNQQRYAYHAVLDGPFSNFTVGSQSFSNVLRVQYTAFSNTGIDTTDVPAFTIFYQNSVGPVGIQRTEAGNTTLLTLKK